MNNNFPSLSKKKYVNKQLTQFTRLVSCKWFNFLVPVPTYFSIIEPIN